MGILEQVMQMKNQGFPEDQIISSLQEQGHSPREIDEALSRSQIKSAVDSDFETTPQNPTGQKYKPITHEVGGEQEYAPQPNEQYAPQEQYYPQQDSYAEYSPQSSMSSDTIIEIAEQVFSEKMKKTQKEIEEITEIKTLMQSKIENIDERLRRVETMIDKLQITILEKISSYGKGIDMAKKEISMVQDSFRKLANPLVEKARNSVSDKEFIDVSKKKISKKK